MRPKVLFAILLVAALVLGVAVLFKKQSPPPVADVPTPMPETNPPAPVAVPAPAPTPVKSSLTPAARLELIHRENEKLAVWAMKSDMQSYSNIIGDLSSPEREIRMSAIEATKQFNSTNAIPVLKAMAENTEDREEADALMDAAEFLSLPDYNLVPANPTPSAPPAPPAADNAPEPAPDTPPQP